MKVYLYYSKNKITKVNDIEIIKQGIANSVRTWFNLPDDIASSDISVICAKISNEIDAFLILDSEVDEDSVKLINIMTKIKSDLIDLLRRDQNSPYMELKIRMKMELNHIPLTSVAETPGGRIMASEQKNLEEDSEIDYERRAKQYVPVEPSYSFDRVILPEEVIEKLEEALGILQYERKVFDEWGLYEIQPHPSSSLSFFGASGTGKTMAAEAIAQKLGKKILKVSYADVESKYHGEGPKMVKAIFLAAEKTDAVLFFDEADSLLSKRLTNVSQGSEQAINSMRSQLLICLEEFRGIVIFATNLVVNYDSAFLTRLISVEFEKPDLETRKKIWDVHVKPAYDGKIHKLNIPLADDVDTRELAEKYAFVGREIRNAVISACITTAVAGRDIVCQQDFISASDKIVKEKESVVNAGKHSISAQSKESLKKVFTDKFREQEELKVGSLESIEEN